ncbi:hypothetical protein OURE66S_00614 [Oligella ureolytica]
MGDFVNSGWSLWVTAISILGVVFVLWLLWTQRSWLGGTVRMRGMNGMVSGN